MTTLENAALAVFTVACLAVACMDDPPRGWPPDDIGEDIGDCCNGLVLPIIFDDPQECINDRTNVEALQHTQCRFINCLGGILTYWFCNCHGLPSDAPCPKETP